MVDELVRQPRTMFEEGNGGLCRLLIMSGSGVNVLLKLSDILGKESSLSWIATLIRIGKPATEYPMEGPKETEPLLWFKIKTPCGLVCC